MWVIKAGFHKMLVRIVNRKGPNQNASEEAVIWVCTVCLGIFADNYRSVPLVLVALLRE